MDCNAPGSPSAVGWKGFKIAVYNIGAATEMRILAGANLGSDVPNARAGKAFFAISDTVKVGQLYRSIVWAPLAHVPLFSGSKNMFGTRAGRGLGAIYYLPLLVLWPLVACLYPYFSRKTGRVNTGVFLVTLFMVWTLAAFGDFAIVP